MAASSVRRRRLHDEAPAAEIEGDVAGQHAQRRADGAGDGVDQRGLAATGFAREAIDLVAGDPQADAVDRAHLARNAERRGGVVGVEVADLEGRRAGHPRTQFRRLRAPMKWCSDTASSGQRMTAVGCRNPPSAGGPSGGTTKASFSGDEMTKDSSGLHSPLGSWWPHRSRFGQHVCRPGLPQ